MRILATSARAIERLAQKESRPRQLIGPSLFRLLAGLNILAQYLVLYGQRHELFGNTGLLTYEQYLAISGRFSLYRFTLSSWAFEVLYHFSVALTMAWAAGYATRWLTPVVLICWSSFTDRGPAMWDGGDNLAALLLIYLSFADLGARLSPASEGKPRAVQRFPALAVLHNVALRACGLQVCIVYFVAGIMKARGEGWPDGSALYASWADREFAWPGVTDVLAQNGSLLSLLGPLTILFQIAFPFFFLLNRRSRVAILVVAMGFHLSIGLLMGLLSFAVFFIAAELALITDHEYRTLGYLLRRYLLRRHLLRRVFIKARASIVSRLGARVTRENANNIEEDE